MMPSEEMMLFASVTVYITYLVLSVCAIGGFAIVVSGLTPKKVNRRV